MGQTLIILINSYFSLTFDPPKLYLHPIQVLLKMVCALDQKLAMLCPRGVTPGSTHGAAVCLAAQYLHYALNPLFSLRNCDLTEATGKSENCHRGAKHPFSFTDISSQ